MNHETAPMTTSIISIQSQVVHGHVGNSAAVLPMQAHGLNVAAVPTTLLSNHPGLGSTRGRVLDAELVGELLRGIEERGLIETSRYIVSGYLGSRANGEVVAAFVNQARQRNPAITYICDPVMGDSHVGVFVPDPVAACICNELVPLADLLTPNHFEAGLIAGHPLATWPELEAAVDKMQAWRGARVVVTSCRLADTPDDSLENIVFEGGTSTRLPSPRLELAAAGTGDLYTGLLTAGLARNLPLVDAARRAAAIVLDVLKRTMAAGEREMQLASVIDALNPALGQPTR
ncbi:pyridoxal kinase [Rhodopseudomonas palustris]|uniref:pyridoxal kinase n=1 Tax=Rhodopseudomonas palustris TaxID=1076 RepID=UPI0022F0CCE5|nr:pyridoxal kinase [Rhodopseudomonas palustris]WBU27902.1 pyridoxal kinase [Rhodopseudomonas palustris]